MDRGKEGHDSGWREEIRSSCTPLCCLPKWAVVMTIRLGKAKLRIVAEDCLDCGAIQTAEWHQARVVELQVDNIKHLVYLYRCASCQSLQTQEPRDG